MNRWKRARSPEQKAQRRQAILAAASDLFVQKGFDAATMSAIARRARLCKGNIYRYFRTKEEIFLAIYLDDLEVWVERVIDGVSRAGDVDKPNRVAEVSRAVAKSLLGCPRLAAMMPLLSSVLERNVKRDRLLTFKRRLAQLLPPLSDALCQALPDLDQASALRAIHLMNAMVAGLWPLAHPNAELQSIVELPEFSHHHPRWERDLNAGIHVVLAGILATKPG